MRTPRERLEELKRLQKGDLVKLHNKRVVHFLEYVNEHRFRVWVEGRQLEVPFNMYVEHVGHDDSPLPVIDREGWKSLTRGELIYVRQRHRPILCRFSHYLDKYLFVYNPLFPLQEPQRVPAHTYLGRVSEWVNET